MLRGVISRLIFGQAKSRVVLGQPSQVIELQGIVRHSAVAAEVERVFQKEFSDFLPSRVVVKDPESLLLFDFVARYVDIVARYVIGVAAALSSGLTYAEQLLLDSLAKLDAIGGSGQQFVELRSKVLARLGEVF